MSIFLPGMTDLPAETRMRSVYAAAGSAGRKSAHIDDAGADSAVGPLVAVGELARRAVGARMAVRAVGAEVRPGVRLGGHREGVEVARVELVVAADVARHPGALLFLLERLQ